MSSIWTKADSRDPELLGREIRQIGIFEELQARGIIVRSGYAAEFTCDDCGDHVEDVVWRGGSGTPLRAFIRCPASGRVELSVEDIEIWEINFLRLADVVSQILGLGGKVVVEQPERVWYLGSGHLGSNTRDAFLVRGAAWDDGTDLLTSCRRLATSRAPLILIPNRLPANPEWAQGHRKLVRMADHYWFTDAPKSVANLVNGILNTHDQAVGLAEDYVFRRRDSTWQLTYQGETANIQHLVGLEHLAKLLSSPHKPIEAAQLVSGDAYQVRAVQVRGCEATDQTSLTEYHRLLAGMEEELAELSPREYARRQELEKQIPVLREHVNKVQDNSGKARLLHGTNQRARATARNAITRALRAIEAVLPNLAKHLKRSIQTGNSVEYSPSETHPWVTS
ncbi:MAG TPA: hypothetical protein PKJ41_14490 [Bryobacteraceae bacterium]|nr:hypothetical protein [Bryobacteraceae bacterium]HPT25152.1 hypothetical protein [Bryobacteraceae bacterium]